MHLTLLGDYLSKICCCPIWWARRGLSEYVCITLLLEEKFKCEALRRVVGLLLDWTLGQIQCGGKCMSDLILWYVTEFVLGGSGVSCE